MATLQKFKNLAMQCSVAQAHSPTRSPTKSPMVQLRCRKTTLQMLLGRSTDRRSPRRGDPPIQLKHLLDSSEEKTTTKKKKKKKTRKKKMEKEKGKDLMRRHSLKELFVSSPPEEETTEESPSIRQFGCDGNAVALGGSVIWSNEPGSPKPVRRGFRSRSLLKKDWRPGLDTIPE